jgi:hypothetical protein
MLSMKRLPSFRHYCLALPAVGSVDASALVDTAMMFAIGSGEVRIGAAGRTLSDTSVGISVVGESAGDGALLDSAASRVGGAERFSTFGDVRTGGGSAVGGETLVDEVLVISEVVAAGVSR